MAEYVTVSLCEDCRLVFPNGAMKVEGDYKKQVQVQGSIVTTRCPECGKEITTLLDNGYWARTN